MLNMLVILAAVALASSCPLSSTTCTSLPQNSIEYDQHLSSLGTLDYNLAVNATRLDSAFQNPSQLRDILQQTNLPLLEVRPGCEERSFQFTVFSGASGAANITCPYTLQCDYNPQRIPAHVFHARCETAELANGTKCREVFYPLVTMTTESCDPIGEGDWLMSTEFVAASCIATQ